MMPREGTTIADRYRLERKVGGGRVSAVWRVRDEISSRPCAIKLLHRSMHKHPEALTRFSLEDRLARELSGPHFPERVGSGVWDGMRYIAWRWHEGETLRALFERNPKQDAPSVHSIVQETCQALSLVHAAGYAHGDLKPENILFADRGEGERSSRQIKLLGFGVASRLARPSAAGFGVSRRRPGELVGTPLYSSPDLILGRVPNGGQADLWALAVIVYEALTGRPPFLGFDIGAVLQAILEKRAPRPSSVADNLPGSFDTWWAQALAQEFDTPNEFAGALARALAPALRTSHTQRSASLPDRASPALEALTPLPASPPRGNASTTASGLGPADLGLARASAAKAVKSVSLAPAPSAAGPAVSAAAVGRHSTPPASPLVAASVSGVGHVASVATASARASSSPGAPKSSAAATADAAAWAEPSLASSVAPSALAVAAAAAPSAATPSPLSAGAAPTANDASPTDPPANDTFVPFPSPLRDLGAEGARKTLVGITPPGLLQSIAAAGGAKPAPALAAAPGAASPAQHAAPAARSMPPASPARATIEGAPCKPIETDDEHGAFDLGGFDGSRRPANPTVPFPRPRAVPRTATMPNLSDETPDIGRASWHGTTTRTLRFVLTSPDHKPQRVAAALVCAAAALVIFAVGRSPIAGTAGIGQTTGALSADPGGKPASPLPPPTDPRDIEPASGVDRGNDAVAADDVDARGRASDTGAEPGQLERDGDDRHRALELAPGLVVPSEGSGPTRPASDTGDEDTEAKSRAAASQPPKPQGKKNVPPPPSPPSLPNPDRKNSTELDFGI